MIKLCRDAKQRRVRGMRGRGGAAIINGLERVQSEGVSWVKERVSHANNSSKSILGRGNSQCKGPEAGVCVSVTPNVPRLLENHPTFSPWAQYPGVWVASSRRALQSNRSGSEVLLFHIPTMNKWTSTNSFNFLSLFPVCQMKSYRTELEQNKGHLHMCFRAKENLTLSQGTIFWGRGLFRGRILEGYLVFLIILLPTWTHLLPRVIIMTRTSPTARGRMCRPLSTVMPAASLGHLSHLPRLVEDHPCYSTCM